MGMWTMRLHGMTIFRSRRRPAKLIFGQSGGGGKVGTLMGMPSAKGLFHRSVESGSAYAVHRRIVPRIRAATLQELGLTADTLDKIRSSRRAVVEAGMHAQSSFPQLLPAHLAVWAGPRSSTAIFCRTIHVSTSHVGAGVPLLVGTVLNEFNTSGRSNPIP